MYRNIFTHADADTFHGVSFHLDAGETLGLVDKIAWIPLHYQVDLYAMQKDKGISFAPRPDRWLVYKEIVKK